MTTESGSAVRRRLATHPQWVVEGVTATTPDGTRVSRRFEFADFAGAFAFMTAVAREAEAIGHHPDWCNSWNVVDIAVTSHEHGRLTDLCVDLVAAIDRLAIL